MRPFRSLPVLLALAPLAACGDLTEMRGPPPYATTSASPSLAQEVGAERALAVLPAEAGQVISVTERREVERIGQTIALAGEGTTQGTNQIRVVAANHDPERRRRPTEETIAAELESEFPDLDMRRTERMITGQGGPIGLATGRAAGGATCLYAWQETEARPGRARGGLFASEQVDLSVRVRLCRRDLGEERAIALVEGLRLRSDVVPMGERGAPVASGVDALASAGYAASASPVTTFAAPTPARHEVVRPARTVAASPATQPSSAAIPVPTDIAARTPVVAAPRIPVAAVAAAPVAAVTAATPTASPAQPAIPPALRPTTTSTASPAIPLPSGG